MATPRKKKMFAAADDNIMVEAVVQLLKEEVDVDEVFRMVRRSDWNWENESLNRNRNLYVSVKSIKYSYVLVMRFKSDFNLYLVSEKNYKVGSKTGTPHICVILLQEPIQIDDE